MTGLARGGSRGATLITGFEGNSQDQVSVQLWQTRQGFPLEQLAGG